MHLKRRKVPENWPIKKKGTKYIARPKAGLKKAVPILIILRDMLGLAQNRKEVKRAIHKKNILVNGRKARDEKNILMLFDTLSIVPMKKHFRLNIDERGKFKLEEINEKEYQNKISKILSKKTLKGRKTQLNLSDGRNFVSNVKCNVNDSVLVNLKDKKIEKCIPLKEKSDVLVFSGKHAGKQGSVNKIKKELKMAEIKFKEESVNVLIKQLIVIK